MFDKNFVEAMPACFVETAPKPCLAMCHFWKPAQNVSHVSLWPNVGKGFVHV
jgi:hypothetical protein